jgi:tripartite-type tricarboxylate transporter receptor subunit TctC
LHWTSQNEISFFEVLVTRACSNLSFLPFKALHLRILKTVLLLGALTSTLAWCQTSDINRYPQRAIHLIVPFTASGPVDTMARVMAQKLGETLNQAMIIENRAGAGGSIGAEFVAHAPADGYTLLFSSAGVVSVNPSLNKVGFDTLKDFVPIVKAGSLASVLVVNPTLKVNSIGELIQLAKSKPGELNFGSSGPGSASHLAMEMFDRAADIKILHIAYKGAAPAVTDLLAGNVQVMLIGLTTVLPFVNNGKLKALGVSTLTPSPIVPQLPTIASAGLNGFEVSNWMGFFAPINTPSPIVQRINDDVNRIIKQNDTKIKLATEGIDPSSANTPGQFKEYVQSEINRWSKIIKESNIKD